MLARIQEQTETLRQNEEIRSFLAAIVESSDDAIVGKDFESRVVSWNAGAERMFGYTGGGNAGPAHYAAPVPGPARGGSAHSGGGQARRDSPLRNRAHPQGRSAHRAFAYRIARSGMRAASIIGISSIARDITERKRAEREMQESRARFSGIIGSAMDAIISIDAGQRITIFNEAAEKMFRCPASEALGQPLDRFIPARFREAHRGHVAAFGHTGVTSRAMGNLRPLSGLRADGEEFPIEASISHIEVGRAADLHGDPARHHRTQARGRSDPAVERRARAARRRSARRN